MALCTDCLGCFTDVFDGGVLPHINKSLSDVSFRELRKFCEEYGSPDGDPRRGTKTFDHIWDAVRRNADKCRSGSSCWFCCWLHYICRTQVMVIGRPKDLRLTLHLQTSLTDGELLAWINFKVADYLFIAMDIGKHGARARFRARAKADEAQRVYTYKLGDVELSGGRRSLHMSRQQIDGIVRRSISRLPDPMVQKVYPSLKGRCSCNDSAEILCWCRVSNVQGWLQECRRDHEICNMIAADNRDQYDEAQESTLPSRLILVGDSDTPTKLVRTSELELHIKQTIRYATLSHCWGTDSFATLTEENYNDFLTEVPVHALAKTFQEAISVCRKLGIQYIWIDCLCIIQNSADMSDWRAEAVRMQHVYGNSYLNLAASASRNSHEGLVTPRNTAFLDDLEFRLPGGLEAYPAGHASARRRAHQTCPLLKRGWVLQECFLAPRVLHFTQSQLTWQCKHSSSTEFKPALSTKTGYFGPTTFEFRSAVAAIASAERLDGLWAQIAADYSWTRVTNGEDRYNALSGLAARFFTRYCQLGVETSYLAGLWEHNLPRFLCFKDSSTNLGVKANIFTPSWSWLGLRAINNESATFTDRAESEFTHLTSVPTKVECTLQHPDLPFGPVSHARIRLTAFLFQLSFELPPGKPSIRDGKAVVHGKRHQLKIITEHDMDNMFYCTWTPDEKFRDTSPRQEELTQLCVLLTADSNKEGWCIWIDALTVMRYRHGEGDESGDRGASSSGSNEIQELAYERTGHLRIRVYPKHQAYRSGEVGRFFSKDNLEQQTFWLC